MNKKLFYSFVLMVMAAFMPAVAQETLTVYEGDANSNTVPAYMFYFDDFTRSQMVIPAADLDVMTGGTISAITFYTDQTAAYTSPSTADVYLMEVDYTSISAFEPKANVNFTGNLSVADDGTLTIQFTTPYVYSGGNLLIGIENTTDAGYKNVKFYGQTVTGASVAGYNANSLANVTASQKNFIAKTTFTYTPGGGVIVPKPTNLTVSDITTNSAKLSWTAGGEETSWQVEYKKAADAEWTTETATSTTYDLDALANGTSYDVRVRSVMGTDYSAWVTANFTTPVCDDANKGEVSYVLTDTYGDGWNGNKLQIVYNGTVIEELTITTGGKDEPITGTVSLCYGVDYDLVWVAGSFGYECGFVLTDSEGQVIYEFHGTGSSSGGSPTSGVLTTFQINQVQFPRPTSLAVSDITATTAVATWAGAADSYNLRYRPVAAGDFALNESFEGSVSWGLIDADGDGKKWGLISIAGSGLEQYDGTDIVLYSASWDADTEAALTPDNWVVSPKITLGGELRFGVCDVGYSETYGVYVSTGGTAVSDFVPLAEGLSTTSSWEEKVYDLSAYEGQQGYIAFRHYDCTDGYFILIDGVKVGNAGAGEQEWIVKENVESPYTMEELTPSTQYEVQVQGVYADGESEWTASVNFTTTDGLEVPTNLAISEITHNSAVATWEGTQESYNLRYRTPGKSDVLFSESFENGLDAWTLVDSDGDGNNWLQFDPTNFTSGGFPAYDGQYTAMSRSWMQTPLTPDNWLISPVIEDLGGTLHYFVVDDGAGYPETYQVYVSTAEGTDVANFVAVSEEMQTPNSIQWTEVTIDLSAYAGQSGRIAFRNFNCTDKDFMLIDAISITKNEVPAGEWTVVEGVTSPADIEGLDPETEYEVQVQGIFGENTTDWTASVLFTTLEAPEITGYDEFYVVGDFNSWNTEEGGGRIELIANEEGNQYTGNVELEANSNFKIITFVDGVVKWFGGESDNGEYFLVNNDMLGITISLIDGANFRVEEGGEYNITVMSVGPKALNEPLRMIITKVSTGISTIGVDGYDNNAWYNLNGQKLNGKPTAPGIYINGNRKVIIK